MSSTLDVYAPCPCGSGKKVKFCCSTALGEMEKIARLHERQQPEQALEALDRLAKKYTDAPIIPITRAQLLIEDGRPDEAAVAMRTLLKAHPENSHATALLAFAQFLDVGFHEAKPEIHRAFQICAHQSPDVIASLAMQISEYVLPENPMAGREHLALALRLTTDPEDRQNVFRELMMLDGSVAIPYPLRGTHQLERVQPPEGSERELKNAYRLSMLGCWEIAGKLFTKLTEKLPESSGLWKNIGLCRAWDDDLAGAAVALHKAAELASEYEDAVECETIAQLLDMADVEEQVPVKATRFRLNSTSKALSVLDDHAQFVRLRNPREDDDSNPQIAGRYYLLNMAPPPESEPVRDDNVPIVLAEVVVYLLDVAPDKTANVLSVMGVDGPDRDQAIQLVESLLRDEMIPLGAELRLDAEDDNEQLLKSETTFREVLKELLPLQRKEYFGKRLKIHEQRERIQNLERHFVRETWCQTPLRRLNGKTPREAADDPALKVKLAAAVHTLGALDRAAEIALDFSKLREELHIDPERPVAFNDESLTLLSVMQSHRLPLQEMTEDQLGHVFQRALLIRHTPFMFAVVSEHVRRGLDCIKGMSRVSFFKTMSELCREMGRHDDAVRWAKRGREEAEQGDDFRVKLDLVTREFEFRAENRDDPELPALVDHIWTYYGEKLPQLRNSIEPVLRDLGLPIPGETASGLVLPESMAVGAGSPAGTSKLWLPD